MHRHNNTRSSIDLYGFICTQASVFNKKSKGPLRVQVKPVIHKVIFPATSSQ